ncbi:superoxide dismutase [Candidatus Babeliales bacterium]|nr:superoxide dismutase [Candidatus Babeliales bacterium]
MFTLPKLPYSYDALMPYIDAKTMEIHLTKHHQAYVDNLNKAIAQAPELAGWTLEKLLRNIDQVPASVKNAVQNNAGGHYNHSLFWEMMSSKGGMVQGTLHDALVKQFGSMTQFQEKFEEAAKTRFGSGWAWLALDDQGMLKIYSTPNQDAPLMLGQEPILGLDVWEHAYYLHYQNRRPDYIAAWWNVVNWEFVEERYRSLVR